MGNAYIFSLQPTFTQGLILGQFSILCLLFILLKYLFFDAASDQPYKSVSYQPRILREEEENAGLKEGLATKTEAANGTAVDTGVESADWLNILLHQVSGMRY